MNDHNQKGHCEITKINHRRKNKNNLMQKNIFNCGECTLCLLDSKMQFIELSCVMYEDDLNLLKLN